MSSTLIDDGYGLIYDGYVGVDRGILVAIYHGDNQI